MGQEIFYCCKCQTRIKGSDFESGEAYRVLDKVACANCVQTITSALTPDQQEEFRNKAKAKAAQTTRGIKMSVPGLRKTTPRMPALPPPEADDAPYRPPPSAEKKNPVMLYAGIGAGVLIVLIVIIAAPSGKPKTGHAPAAVKTSTDPEAAPAFDLPTLLGQADAYVFKQEFKKAIDVLKSARDKAPSPDWLQPLNKKIREIKGRAEAIFIEKKARAVEAKRAGSDRVVQVIREEIALWGMEDLLADFDREIAETGKQ